MAENDASRFYDLESEFQPLHRLDPNQRCRSPTTGYEIEIDGRICAVVDRPRPERTRNSTPATRVVKFFVEFVIEEVGDATSERGTVFIKREIIERTVCLAIRVVRGLL